MGVFMYSQTCIEQSPSEDGVPQNRGYIKMMKNVILCYSWFYVQKLLKNTINISFGREKWI